MPKRPSALKPIGPRPCFSLITRRTDWLAASTTVTVPSLPSATYAAPDSGEYTTDNGCEPVLSCLSKVRLATSMMLTVPSSRLVTKANRLSLLKAIS
ncbi:hypothetical protein D3C73_458000 [compost metagenome]